MSVFIVAVMMWLGLGNMAHLSPRLQQFVAIGKAEARVSDEIESRLVRWIKSSCPKYFDGFSASPSELVGDGGSNPAHVYTIFSSSNDPFGIIIHSIRRKQPSALLLNISNAFSSSKNSVSDLIVAAFVHSSKASEGIGVFRIKKTSGCTDADVGCRRIATVNQFQLCTNCETFPLRSNSLNGNLYIQPWPLRQKSRVGAALSFVRPTISVASGFSSPMSGAPSSYQRPQNDQSLNASDDGLIPRIASLIVARLSGESFAAEMLAALAYTAVACALAIVGVDRWWKRSRWGYAYTGLSFAMIAMIPLAVIVGG